MAQFVGNALAEEKASDEKRRVVRVSASDGDETRIAFLSDDERDDERDDDENADGVLRGMDDENSSRFASLAKRFATRFPALDLASRGAVKWGDARIERERLAHLRDDRDRFHRITRFTAPDSCQILAPIISFVQTRRLVRVNR